MTRPILWSNVLQSLSTFHPKMLALNSFGVIRRTQTLKADKPTTQTPFKKNVILGKRVANSPIIIIMMLIINWKNCAPRNGEVNKLLQRDFCTNQKCKHHVFTAAHLSASFSTFTILKNGYVYAEIMLKS